MISIILMEPENCGNIGAVARSMANFGLRNLVLVNPKADHLCGEAIARSKHAKDILMKAKVVKQIEGFDTLIATTAKLGSDYNIPRSPIVPEELSQKISNIEGKIGIIFGREGIGLTNNEISECDFIVTIPSSKKYGVLNLSHAVTIICYELFKEKGRSEILKRFKPIPSQEKRVILEKIDSLLDKLDFKTEEKKITQKKFWKRVIGKSFLTKREAYVLLGFLKKINEKIIHWP